MAIVLPAVTGVSTAWTVAAALAATWETKIKNDMTCKTRSCVKNHAKLESRP